MVSCWDIKPCTYLSYILRAIFLSFSEHEHFSVWTMHIKRLNIRSKPSPFRPLANFYQWKPILFMVVLFAQAQPNAHARVISLGINSTTYTSLHKMFD